LEATVTSTLTVSVSFEDGVMEISENFWAGKV
jgi:hypothetical protein